MTGWRFVATVTESTVADGESDVNDQLQLQIWHNGSNHFILSQAANIPISTSNISQVLPANSMGMSLLEVTLNEPIKVEDGDIFGIFQPSSQKSQIVLQFQSGLAPVNYLRPTNAPTTQFTLRGIIADHDYPLVTVQYGKFMYET